MSIIPCYEMQDSSLKNWDQAKGVPSALVYMCESLDLTPSTTNK